MRGNLKEILGFCTLQFLLAILMLFCVQVVQISNNEYSWREEKKNSNFILQTSKRYVSLPRK